MNNSYELKASAPIGVFDSGIGGTTILKSVKQLLPHEDYIFFGDSKNCPYGTKSLDELKAIVRKVTEFLLERHVKIIIVACNTATTQTIDYLRETYPFIKFVGTEPAIKLACDSGKPRLMLLSTEGTAHSPRTDELISENIREGQKIVNFPCLNLAETIETMNFDKIRACLAEDFKDIRDPEMVDVVILGCTHYPIVKAEIQKYFPYAELVDGGDGVARQTKKLLEEQNLLNPSGSGKIEYHFSRPERYDVKALVQLV